MGKAIDKNKPLPEHTKFKYEECYAKVFLEFYFHEKFSGLVVQDKPDLLSPSKKIGIEVTDCTDQNHREALKLWYTMPYVSEKEKIRNIERMKQLGVEYQGGIQVWPTINLNNGIESSVYDSLFDALKNKLKKLNQSNLYKPCNEYCLFIYSELWFYDKWRTPLAEKLAAISSEYEKIYSEIYISTQNEILCIDVKTLTVIPFDIKEDQYSLACKAREMVEEGEQDVPT